MALEYKGVPGLWLPEDMAASVLIDVEALPLLRKKLTLVEAQLELSQDSLDRLAQLRAVERQHCDTLQDTAEHSLEALKVTWEDNKKLRKGNAPWWKHPALWFCAGVIVTTGLIFTGFRISKISD